MARIFGSQLAADHGLDWHAGRKIEKVTEGTVRLDDGTLLNADLVVAGIGVAPRIKLAQAAGIAVDDGVLVDENLPFFWTKHFDLSIRYVGHAIS